MNVNRNSVHRTLVLFPGSLGDLICALPAIEAIRTTYSEELSLAVRGEAFELASSFAFAHKVISLENRIFSQLFSSSPNLSMETLSSFSHIFSWYGHTHEEVKENLCLLSANRARSFAFFTGQYPCHAVSYYLQCLDERVMRCPSLSIPQVASLWGDQYWRQREWRVPLKLLVLHPGSGGKRKRWEFEGFQKVARWWESQRGRKALILLGPAEEKERSEWIHVGETVTDFSLWQVAVLLNRACAYLGNDSGVSHLAGAIGARGVVLFGPTQPQQWRPLGGCLYVLRNAAYRAVDPSQEGISLREISADEVIAALSLSNARADLPFC